MLRHPIQLLCALAFLSSCGNSGTKTTETQTVQAGPVAKKIAHEMQEHAKVRTDDYFWMRLTDEQKEASTPDAQTKDVLDYLNAENAYQKEVLAHTDTLQKALFNEMVSRIKQDDSSVPYKLNGYFYYNRFEKGQDYALECRKKGDEKGVEEIMLNGPELAKGHAYFAISGHEVSSNNNILAYAVDTVSRRMYTVYFKDLNSGALLADQLTNVDGGITWANDNRTVFYAMQDTVTLRSYRIYKHTLGAPQSADSLVYEEADETFGTYVYKTKSKKYIVIASSETLTSEYRVLEADQPNGEFRIIQPRVVGLEYSIDHLGDHFYIRTNLDATNFKLMRTPLNATTKENWTDVIPHRSDVLLSDVELFKDYLVLSERKDGLLQIRMKRWDNTSDTYMEFNDPTYSAYVAFNPEINTSELRYYYTSMTTPGTTYAYDMKTAKRTLLKQQEVLGGKFDAANYAS